MPVKTMIDLERDITEHTATGKIADGEMFEAQREFYASGPTRLQLWDMTACSVTDVTIGGMRTFIERAAKLGRVRENGRTAVIVDSQIKYGLARMAEAFGEFAAIPFAFRIFKNRDDAMNWLQGDQEG